MIIVSSGNVVVSTCLIAGYVNNNQPSEALNVFKDMGNWGYHVQCFDCICS